jgi:hypothetical protein
MSKKEEEMSGIGLRELIGSPITNHAHIRSVTYSIVSKTFQVRLGFISSLPQFIWD